jgi:hypothetical protein
MTNTLPPSRHSVDLRAGAIATAVAGGWVVLVLTVRAVRRWFW